LNSRAQRNRGANVVIKGTLKDGVVRDLEFPGGEPDFVSKDGGSKVSAGYIREVFRAVF
jgi:hypothetical protein